jgi:glutathione S-transferase
MHLYAALITALTVLLVVLAMYLVGKARGKHQVHAPATIGPPEFERAFRAHQNTLEQTIIFLPALWLATLYSHELVAAILGAVWLVGRLSYLFGYIQDAKKRGMGFLVGFVAFVGLLGMALWGIVAGLLAR